MSQDLLNDLVRQAIGLHKQERYNEAELIYNRVLNRDPFNKDLLFLLGDLYIRKEYNALGIILYASLLGQDPQNGAAWCNMGIGYRKEGDTARAMECWQRCIAASGESVEVCNNIAGIYSDSGQPHEALKWLGKSLSFNPDDLEANWQKALAHLTLADWETGWKQFEWRQKTPHWDSRPSVDAPIWDWKPVDNLYIHGEQGVGDEIMFLSALPHALPYAKQVTLEVNKKVAGICKQTWPQCKVVKEATPGKYDAKVPVGSLIGRFGMNPKPYLKPHPDKVAFYRRELEKQGPGPYVALCWVGGTKLTRVEHRTILLKQLEPIMQKYTCVSAQYNDTCPIVDNDRIECGLAKINEESAGGDLHDQAALFKAVDAVVTVQQTAVHVAGGVGAPTFALIGERPHWRYGITGERMPFYSSVKLLRKTSDWDEVVQRALKDLDAHFSRVQAAESSAA